MLYPITRPLATLALKANYKKIKLSNTDRIPKDKPVILAANHPTAFIEPCILACFLDRPLYFLVRGVFFRKSFYESLLRNLHMLPVYRMRDGGFTNLKQNYATFESCFQALKSKKTIMILAEGRTIHEKRLRPLRKGAARIALGTLDKFPEVGEVYVVPVGVNYTYADQSRSEVLIDFGHPMLASDYLASFQDQPNQAVTSFTNDLRSRMLQHIVVIEEAKDEELTERLLVMYRSDHPEERFPVLERDFRRLEMELDISDKVNSIGEEEKAKLWGRLDRYFEKLKKLGVRDELVSSHFPEKKGMRSLLLVLTFPLFIAGSLWKYLPLRLAKWIVDKNVRAIEFYEPIRLAVSIGAFLIWGILWLIICTSVLGWWGVPVFIALFLCGYFAVVYQEMFQSWKSERKVNNLQATELERLREDRKEILDYFRELKFTQPTEKE